MNEEARKKLLEIRSKELKQPTTIDEQISILKSRNVIIEDEKYAEEVLKIFNYYFITGYLYPYKLKDNKYSKISFNDIVFQIKFDMRLREICMYCIDIIEKSLKTIIAYHFSHKYECGNLAYSDELFFPGHEDTHKKLISYYNLSVQNNKDLPFVKHNQEKYGILPTWVAIELFTLGNVENFFKILNSPTVKEIEKTIGFPKNKVRNWIENIRIFRNMVAHNQRLYNFPIMSTPIKAKEYKEQTGRIFDYVIVMKYLFLDKNDWNDYVIPRFEYIFESFKDKIDLKCIGFPENWKVILLK